MVAARPRQPIEGGSPGRGTWTAWGAAWVLGGFAAGCAADKGAGELHAEQVLLEREVEGLRASVAKLDRGEPLLPEEAVVVSIAEEVVKEFVGAQLPVTIELESFRIELSRTRRRASGARPSVDPLRDDRPPGSPRLRRGGRGDRRPRLDRRWIRRRDAARDVAVDHVDLLRMGGLEKLHRRGRRWTSWPGAVRKQLAGQHPQDPDPGEDRAGHRAARGHGGSRAAAGSVDAARGERVERPGRPGRALDRHRRRAGRAGRRPPGRDRDEGAAARGGGAPRCARLASLGACRAGTRPTPEEMKARNQALERERDELESRLGELVAKDPRLAGLPENGVRVGVPTSLARTLVQRVLGRLRRFRHPEAREPQGQEGGQDQEGRHHRRVRPARRRSTR